MTIEESIVRALETKLKNRYYAEKGQVSLDFIETAMMDIIDELRGEEVPEALIDKVPVVKPSEAKYLSEKTKQAVEASRMALYSILSKVIVDPDFDPDGYLSAMTYWYEFQQLAKSYGKKLIYVTPKKKEGK